MRKKTGSFGFWAATIIFLLIAAFSFAGTVMSRTNPDWAAEEAYYGERERQTEIKIRKYLSERGFDNSGVTLTRVVDGKGAREYTVTVHHKAI